MEYINIISKEAITVPIAWPAYVVGGLAIAGVLGILFYSLRTRKYDSTVKWLGVFGGGGMVLMLLTILICSIFFRVPTGKYKYEATIDKEKITVSQYEKFIEKYNPTIIDGVYYWEDTLTPTH